MQIFTPIGERYQKERKIGLHIFPYTDSSGGYRPTLLHFFLKTLVEPMLRPI